MRLSAVCLFCAVAAALAIRRSGTAPSDGGEVAASTDAQQRPPGVSEGKVFQAASLTDNSLVNRRHTSDLKEARVASSSLLADKGEQQSEQQQQQNDDTSKKGSVVDGRQPRQTEKPEPKTAPSAHSACEREKRDERSNKHRMAQRKTERRTARSVHSTHDRGKADEGSNKEKKAELEGSDGEGRKAEHTGVEEKAEGSDGAGHPEHHQSLTSTDKSTAEPTGHGNEGWARDAVIMDANIHDAKTVVSADEINPLGGIPMTPEQRLELLLDYTSPLRKGGYKDKDRKSSSVRKSSIRPSASTSPRRTGRQRTPSSARRIPRNRHSVATSALIQAARESTHQPWRDRSPHGARSSSAGAVALGGIAMATLAVLARVYSREDRGYIRVDMHAHSPHFAQFTTWAAQRRAHLGVRPQVLSFGNT